MESRPILRFQLALAIGLLFSGALVGLVLHTPPAAEAGDVPILDPVATTTSVTSPPTTAGPDPEASGGSAGRLVQTSSVPVEVPRNEYAPEPVQEIGTMEIPKLGVRQPIFNGITMRNIDKGPSHWPGTALPGEVGNTVFAGHRTTKTRPFRDIDQLTPGDPVVFDVAGVRSTYVVTGSKIVLPTALEIINPTPTATGTLFACHPPGSAKFRYVVLLALSEAVVSG